MTISPEQIIAPPSDQTKVRSNSTIFSRLRPISVAEYEKMIETGILQEDERCELIDGVIIAMSPLGSKHVACVNRATRLFLHLVQDKAIVSVQNAFRLNEQSRPEPDLAIIRKSEDDYDDQLPGAEDVLLLIEVSDSTLIFDRNDKAPRYAEAGIPELWIVDLQNQLIEAHTNPKNGIYHHIRRATRGETLVPQFDSNATVLVDDILGKARN